MLIRNYLGYHYTRVCIQWYHLDPPPPPKGFVTKKHFYIYQEVLEAIYIVNIILWETLVNIIFTNTVVIVLDFTVVKWVVKLSLTDCSILLKSSIGSYYVISVGVLLRRFTGQTGSCMTMIYSGKYKDTLDYYKFKLCR